MPLRKNATVEAQARGKGLGARGKNNQAHSLAPLAPRLLSKGGTSLADINHQQAAEKPIRHSRVWRSLVCLVDLVYLVYLVCFVHLVSFVQQKNQTDQTNQTDQIDQSNQTDQMNKKRRQHGTGD